jgi:hypothetical protein
MGRRLSRAAGCAALWALLSPHAAALLVAAHLADHHEGRHEARHEDGAAGLALVWHGHGHDAETPQHDHAALAPDLVPPPSKATLHLHASSTFGASADSRRAVPSAGWLRPIAIAGVGPPARIPSFSILRV